MANLLHRDHGGTWKSPQDSVVLLEKEIENIIIISVHRTVPYTVSIDRERVTHSRLHGHQYRYLVPFVSIWKNKEK